MSMSLVCCALALASSCKDNTIRIKRNIVQKGVLCSAQIKEISSVRNTINLFKMDNVIGIYKKNNTTGHICYWKKVESGLVNLKTLSGGIYLSSGM